MADDRDDRPLLLHKANESPPGYRVSYDGVEIGSISETVSHVNQLTFWRWAVDTMPLMDPRRAAAVRASADAG